jgi:thioredoxin:protein disulfide reductase
LYRSTGLGIGTLLVFAAAGGLAAAVPSSVVSVQASLPAGAVHPGSAAKIEVAAQIAPGYHINAHHPSLDYLIPTNVTFDDSSELSVGNEAYPGGQLKKFAFLDSPISVYEGKILIGATVRTSRSLAPGTYALRGKFAYQACNDHACLAPTSVPFELTVKVLPGATCLRSLHTLKRLRSLTPTDLRRECGCPPHHSGPRPHLPQATV